MHRTLLAANYNEWTYSMQVISGEKVDKYIFDDQISDVLTFFWRGSQYTPSQRIQAC